ncbi:uncharacterized protein LTR77_006487 [Saxophila tyrrhenica]|uniref:Uncharacterized protein n=1 Tax=Saxophila tyrrhenica TaxID=1690608 RepID=A0AAV9P815_9PEZI|nr:hypothetical protein LTR77_006487 [Saxophila tyrrhenica]
MAIRTQDDRDADPAVAPQQSQAGLYALLRHGGNTSQQVATPALQLPANFHTLLHDFVANSSQTKTPSFASTVRLNLSFLDLPPELRNVVYEDLLTLQPNGSPQNRWLQRTSCHPQILRTCKEIHGEAHEILETAVERKIYDLLTTFNGRQATNIGDYLPYLLRRTSKLVLAVNLGPTLRSDGEAIIGVGDNWPRDIILCDRLLTSLNHTLHQVYQILPDSKIRMVDLTITASAGLPHPVNDGGLASLLSPAVAIAAKTQHSTESLGRLFTGFVAVNMASLRTALRLIDQLREEATLLNKLHTKFLLPQAGFKQCPVVEREFSRDGTPPDDWVYRLKDAARVYRRAWT